MSSYRPKGTLYGDETSAAIVAGWELSLAGEVPPERVEALEKTLLAALAARGLAELTLYVPGDTTVDTGVETSGPLVFGTSVVWVEANEPDPGAVDPAKVEAAVASLPTLDDAFWREVLGFFDGMQPPEAPAAYLLSWGPLCYGAIYAGVSATSEDEAVYSFIANQDMNQGWSSDGVDGEYLMSAEFSDVVAVDLSPEHLKKAERLDSPGFWLICRYD